MARHYCKFRSAHAYKTLVHGSVNNAQDVCVVFVITIFCVKDVQVQAFRALIVNLKWLDDDSFTVPFGFCPISLENLPHTTFREVFMNCRVQVRSTADPRTHLLQPTNPRVTVTSKPGGTLVNTSSLCVLGFFSALLMDSLIHSVICLTTGPTPLPKRFLHIVRSRASSFK
jgi:hypothetical protein